MMGPPSLQRVNILIADGSTLDDNPLEAGPIGHGQPSTYLSDDLALYVLTVEESNGSRYQSALHQAKQIAALSGSQPIMIQGVHAGKTDVRDQYDSNANHRHMKYPMSGPEIGCYLSHRLAWNRFLETGSAYALILEDDFIIRDIDVLTAVIRTLPRFDFRWDIIKLHDFTVRPAFRSRQFEGFEVRQAASPAACATAYFVTRIAARNLLRDERPVYRPIDHDFKYYWETRTRIFTIVPNPIGEKGEDLGGSALEDSRQDIKANKTLIDDIRGLRLTASRAVLNFFYRRILSLDPPRDQR